MKQHKYINLELIKSLKPCENRLAVATKYYATKQVTPKQFMGLKHITHEDKLWVAFRLIPKAEIQFAAADIAESVLHIFETKYPNDDRPRKAIEAARSSTLSSASALTAYVSACSSGQVVLASMDYATSPASYAAYAAAYAAYATSATTTTSAAYDTSTIATTSAAYADYAAAYADYATSATPSTSYVSARLKQEKLIRTIILKYWK